jgi:hypothetical protein
MKAADTTRGGAEVRFRRQRTEFEHLEAALRAERPEPSDDLVRRTSEFLAESRERFRLPRLRLALVGMLTVSFLAVVAAFGGLNVAQSSANSAKWFFKTGSFSSNNTARGEHRWGNSAHRANGNQHNGGLLNHDNDPDHDQYDDHIVICHTNGGDGHTLRLSTQAAGRHLANHDGDTLGPCPSDNND